MTRRARAYEARVRARRSRAGQPVGPDPVGRDPEGGADGGGPPDDARGLDDALGPTDVSPVVPGDVQVVDGEPFTVRTVTGTAASKAYTCPRCLQTIPPRFPHLVTWPLHPPLHARLDGAEGLSVRRHWHRHCWASHVRATAGGRSR